jgi:predicted nucleic acid-binding protein
VDLRTAAIAVSQELILLTMNGSDFGNFAEPQMEGWTV